MPWEASPSSAKSASPTSRIRTESSAGRARQHSAGCRATASSVSRSRERVSVSVHGIGFSLMIWSSSGNRHTREAGADENVGRPGAYRRQFFRRSRAGSSLICAAPRRFRGDGRRGARVRPAGPPRRARPRAREHDRRVRERARDRRHHARDGRGDHRRRRGRRLARPGAESGHRPGRERPVAEGPRAADQEPDPCPAAGLRRRPARSGEQLCEAVSDPAGEGRRAAAEARRGVRAVKALGADQVRFDIETKISRRARRDARARAVRACAAGGDPRGRDDASG